MTLTRIRRLGGDRDWLWRCRHLDPAVRHRRPGVIELAESLADRELSPGEPVVAVAMALARRAPAGASRNAAGVRRAATPFAVADMD